MIDAIASAVVVWLIVSAVWLLAGAMMAAVIASDAGWFSDETKTAARWSLAGFLWPLITAALPFLFVAVAIGRDPRDWWRDRQNRKELERINADRAKRLEAAELKEKINSMERELGMELTE